MGQQVQAVAYGVFLTPEQCDALRDEDGEWLDFPETGGRVETGCGLRNAIAVSVAVADVWDERYDEVQFPECTVSELEKELCAPLAIAKKRWKKLVKWAAKHGVTLSDPEVLFLEVERA